MKKKEKIFILGILVFALILWCLMTWLRPRGYGSIRIQADGNDYGTYSLSEDQIISIGSTNVCEIKDGKAFMSESTCPDHLCMKQRSIDDSGGLIVCLPNRITIEGEKSTASSQGSSGIDAVTW
ncbi:MAG: NusG domain II-containing protein [Lachnospiraceae bacterium]|nr:NusG domain II-containing protein [Lachnospiraceae bacterium]